MEYHPGVLYLLYKFKLLSVLYVPSLLINNKPFNIQIDMHQSISVPDSIALPLVKMFWKRKRIYAHYALFSKGYSVNIIISDFLAAVNQHISRHFTSIFRSSFTTMLSMHSKTSASGSPLRSTLCIASSYLCLRLLTSSPASSFSSSSFAV